MACENNGNAVSHTAGLRTGINRLQSKFSGVTGRMVGAVTGATGRSATAALFALESFDGPRSLDALVGPAATIMEAGALLTALRPISSSGARLKLDKVVLDFEGVNLRFEAEDAPRWLTDFYERRQAQRRRLAGDSEARHLRPDKRYEGEDSAEPREKTFISKKPSPDRIADTLRKRTLLALGLIKLGQVGATFLGTGLARMSRLKRVGVVDGVEQRFFFLQTTRVPVAVWRSHLTPLLNLIDSGPAPVVKSDGIMFELGGKTWHRGTVVIQTAQGERTMTHLQSLSAPATHYYFSRRLDDNEAVGIASNQKGFDPKHLPDRNGAPSTGYAGQISEVESLLPVWASIKRGLIQAHLRWGAVSPQDRSEQRAVAPGSATSLEALAPTGSKNEVNDPHPSRERSKGKRHSQPKRTALTEPAQPDERVSQPGGGTEIHPLDNIGPRVRMGDRDYKVMVSRVRPASAGQPSLAEAAYYDDEAAVWKQITDLATREKLAAQVEAGLVQPFSQFEAPQ